MEDIIKSLTSIAGDLDKSGNSSFADRVDIVANNMLDVKTAQYVGGQGYWVRNQRCWSNCYRNKRLTNPSMASQEVWAGCHKEYVEAIDSGKTEKWDKYAGSKSNIKSVDARKYIDEYIKIGIDKKIAEGKDLESSVISSINEGIDENFNKLITSSNELLDMADKVKSFDMSMKLAIAATDISKEAHWYNPASWAAKGVGKAQDVARGATDWAANKRQQDINRGQERIDRKRQQEQARGYLGQEGTITAPPGQDLTGDALPGTPGGPYIQPGQTGQTGQQIPGQTGQQIPGQTGQIVQPIPGQTVPGAAKTEGQESRQAADVNGDGILSQQEMVNYQRDMDRKNQKISILLKNQAKMDQYRKNLQDEYGGARGLNEAIKRYEENQSSRSVEKAASAV